MKLKLYTISINGKAVKENEGENKGKTCKLTSREMRDLLMGLFKEKSPNNIGDTILIFRVR